MSVVLNPSFSKCLATTICSRLGPTIRYPLLPFLLPSLLTSLLPSLPSADSDTWLGQWSLVGRRVKGWDGERKRRGSMEIIDISC